MDSLVEKDYAAIQESLQDFEKVLKNPNLRQKEKNLLEVAKAQMEILKTRKFLDLIFKSKWRVWVSKFTKTLCNFIKFLNEHF